MYTLVVISEKEFSWIITLVEAIFLFCVTWGEGEREEEVGEFSFSSVCQGERGRGESSLSLPSVEGRGKRGGGERVLFLFLVSRGEGREEEVREFSFSSLRQG